MLVVQVESFKVFRDLVESRSFSKAASLNFITQSAVSQQVRAMEERFQVPLFERNNKQFGLTQEGALLYEVSKQIVFKFLTRFSINSRRCAISFLEPYD